MTILALRLCHPKFPFPAAVVERKVGPLYNPEFRLLSHRTSGPWAALQLFRIESSASNCRLHSAGGSRSRSMPMPRGQATFYGPLYQDWVRVRRARWYIDLSKRCTSRERKAERPWSLDLRQRHPATDDLATIALTRRARRSNCSGRTSLRDLLCGSRIWRDLLEAVSARELRATDHPGNRMLRPRV